MKALIHIGFNKTGSTSIQESLYRSRQSLAENNILYPDLGICQHYGLMPLFVAQPEQFIKARVQSFDRQQTLDWARSQQTKLDRQLCETSANLCVLSSEFFSYLECDGVSKFKEFLDARFNEYEFIAYLREAEGLYCSYLQEVIKNASIPRSRLPTPWEFQSMNRSRIEKFVDCFGAGRVRVVKFSRSSLFEGNVVRDFAHQIGYSEAITPAQSNPSAPAAITAMRLLLGVHFPKWKDGALSPEWKWQRASLENVVSQLKENKQLPALKLENSIWLEILKFNHNEESHWLNEFFFEGEKVFTISDRQFSLEEIEQFTRNDFEDWILSYLTPEAIADTVGLLLTSEFTRFQTLRKQVDRLQQERDQIKQKLLTLRKRVDRLRQERDRIKQKLLVASGQPLRKFLKRIFLFRKS